MHRVILAGQERLLYINMNKAAENSTWAAADEVARNDLHRFDPELLRWRELGPGRVSGVPPGPRFSAMMTAVGDSFFVLGGWEVDEDGRYGFPHARTHKLV